MGKDYSSFNRPGDQGKTSIIGGECNKNSLRVEAYGCVDELNSIIGLSLARAKADSLDFPELKSVQQDLFVLGAELARVDSGSASEASTGKRPSITQTQIKRLEKEIAGWEAHLPQVHHFILPGGTPLSALLQFCRAACRRAERRILDLHDQEPVSAEDRAYVNRLSDWLYVLSRVACKQAGAAEEQWIP